MSWEDQIRTASWRGVEFIDTGTTDEFGNRVQVNEYPFRDKPGTKALGKSADRFTVDGFVIGPDYMVARGKLRDAVAIGGPGTLVHPFWGTIRVQCEKLTGRQSHDQGGSYTFTMTFVEAGEKRTPTEVINTATAVTVESQAAVDGIGLAVLDAALLLEEVGVPSYVAEVFGASFGQHFTTVIGPAFQRLIAYVDDAAEFVFLLSNPGDGPVAFIDWARQVLGSVEGLTVLLQTYEAFKVADMARPLDLTTDGSARIAEATEVFEAGLRAIVLTAAADAATVEVFDSFDLAVIQRDILVLALDEQADEIGNVQVIDALLSLRSAVYDDITEKAVDLPKLESVTLAVPTPDIVLAYDLYEDPDRGEEITARADVTHPGYLPAETPIRVLSR